MIRSASPGDLCGRVLPEVHVAYGEREVAFYALSVGAARDMADERALPFVFEGASGGLVPLPSMGFVLADPGFWMPGTGLDTDSIVHLGARLRLDAPLPTTGQMRRRSRVVHVADKGPDRGALIVAEGVLHAPDADGDGPGRIVARVEQIVLARGDGGFGGGSFGTAEPGARIKPPDREPDASSVLQTRADQALLYRWNGDLNPLHADPALARAAGFPRPILHGLGTLGICTTEALRACLDYECGGVRGIDAAFSGPFLPGDTLGLSLWREPGSVIVSAKEGRSGAGVLMAELHLAQQSPDQRATRRRSLPGRSRQAPSHSVRRRPAWT